MPAKQDQAAVRKQQPRNVRDAETLFRLEEKRQILVLRDRALVFLLIAYSAVFDPDAGYYLP